MELKMFRKLTLSALAVAALGMAALVPTTADAGHKHKHWHNWHGPIVYGGPAYYGGPYASCWVKRWVKTPYGPRLKRVYICY
jgi:hypothetical protein